jgi:hypothetical protein
MVLMKKKRNSNTILLTDFINRIGDAVDIVIEKGPNFESST